MRLSLTLLRFQLRTARPLAVPEEKYANVIRGALGLRLRDTGYDHLFEPAAGAPSGLANSPRPFLLRVQRNPEGLILNVHLFGPSPELAPPFTDAIQHMAVTGLGPGRVPVTVTPLETTSIQLSLTPTTPAPSKIQVHFLTPTEFKHDGQIARHAHFPALFHRLRDRILFFAAPNQDHSELARQLAAHAAEIWQIDEQLTHMAIERTSTRTGQTHPLGGFLGHATYTGDFETLWPWLLAAEWTGVGRQTAWGKGHLRCEPIPP